MFYWKAKSIKIDTMGKVLIFIITTITLFQAHGRQCSSFFASESSIKLNENESNKIKWVYDSNPSHGYVSEGSLLRWLDINNKLKPEERIEIPHADGRIVAFHRLRKGNVGQNYAAVAGVGVVNVKLIDARTTGQFDRYLKAKLKMIEFFTQKGFIDAPITYMDHFFSEKINKWVIVSWYNPGISVTQLPKFLKGKELEQAQTQYNDFVSRVQQAAESSTQAPISPHRVANYVEKYAIFFNNKWSFNFF